jgi:hypothetical protein
MIARPLQFFSVLLLVATSGFATLQPGSVARLAFRDVDGNTISTADGHVTVITVVTRQNENQAHSVADHVPDQYLGNQKFRYVTLVNFQRKLPGPLHSLTRVVIRQRLDGEAERLRPEYQQKNIGHDPRRDMFVIADFDGSAVTQLGLAPDSNEVAVFVFNGRGKLIQHWNGVPPGDALGKAISAAEQG